MESIKKGLSAAKWIIALAVLFPSAPGSAASAPTDLEKALQEAEERIVAWDVAGAGDILASLPAQNDHRVLWFKGQVEFFSGNYEAALGSMERLLDERGKGPGLSSMLRLARDTYELSRRFTSFESDHFVVFLEADRDRLLAEPALQTMEAAYRRLGDWLDIHPGDKIRIEIIPTAGDFERVSSLTLKEIEQSGAVGICKFNKIMVLSPRLLLQGYRWRDSLAHEYLHYLLVRLTSNRAPIWLQEGVARYGESLWRSQESRWFRKVEESLLAGALRAGALVSFRSMEPSLVLLPTTGKVRLAFAECALAVEYILREWGIEGLRRLLASLAGGGERGGTDAAMRESLGVDLATFEERWRLYLEGARFEEVPGITVHGFKVLPSGGDVEEEWDLERWQPERSRRHLKLGDMLRARNRYGAALREYRKAQKISPASPYVLNRVGRVLIDLDRTAEAVAAFRQALQVYPDYPTSYVNMAEVFIQEGRWREARRALEEYLDINPFNPYVWKELGAVFMELGETGDALRTWETAFGLNPGDPELRRVLGKP